MLCHLRGTDVRVPSRSSAGLLHALTGDVAVIDGSRSCGRSCHPCRCRYAGLGALDVVIGGLTSLSSDVLHVLTRRKAGSRGFIASGNRERLILSTWPGSAPGRSCRSRARASGCWIWPADRLARNRATLLSLMRLVVVDRHGQGLWRCPADDVASRNSADLGGLWAARRV